MDLSLAVSPIVLAVSAVAAGALSWWSYGRSTPTVTGGKRIALAGLRFAALFLVLLLLLDPVWKRITRTGEPPLLAVLVDDSESLRLGTGGPTPATQVRAALEDVPADAALRFYRFSSEATPAGTVLEGDSLTFEGERTDITEALARVEADFAGRNLRGVVLVSDGRITDGRNPSSIAERFPVPVWTAVAGDSVSSRDVRLQRVVTNDVASAGSPLPIQAGVRSTGYDGQSIPVTVSSGGRVVARTVLEAADGAEAIANLEVTPRSPGLARYTVTAGPLAGEATTRNNSQTVSVRVVDDRRQVLVVAAAPSPDLSALRATLDADESVEATSRTQRAPGVFYEGALPEALGRFDLLILAGYPGRVADAGTAERLAEAARRGLPVLFLLTTATDLSRLASTFGDVLPLVPDAVRDGLLEVALDPTSAGESHPVLEDVGVATSRLTALPPLGASASRWALQPSSRILATASRGGASGAPLLAVRSGRIRSAALVGSGTWRWRTLPDDLEDLRGVYGTLIDRLIRWTTATRDRRPVRVRPDRARFGERDPVTFTGQVYSEDLTPIDDARLVLTVRGAGLEDESAPMRPLGNGRYVADLGVRPPGRYSFSAIASRGGARLGSDQGSFSVGQIAAEFREPGADPALMRLVALRSGGSVVALDSLGAFIESLRDTGVLADRPLVREDETPLLDLWPLLALAIGLLTIEWVWRKRLGMV